jgi:hypothetical protein
MRVTGTSANLATDCKLERSIVDAPTL